jgi:uracil phosphoribosyltransferase
LLTIYGYLFSDDKYLFILFSDEETAEPILFYSKLPPLADQTVVVVDPMVATGGSAICAINVLLEKGADIKKMYFFNVVSCPEGLQRLQTTFPDLTIVMGALDEKLNEKV